MNEPQNPSSSDPLHSATDSAPGRAMKAGRNDPCPCGSGRKYKRCHGLESSSSANEAPSVEGAALNDSSVSGGGGMGGLGGGPGGGFDPSAFDPALMNQLMSAFQRMPKGQLQRFQSVMQKAMSGKDVTREAQELEASMPIEIQNLFRSEAVTSAMQKAYGFGADAPGSTTAGAPAFSSPALDLGTAGGATGGQAAPGDSGDSAIDEKALEEARRLVAQAAAQGKISQEEASSLLSPEPAKKKGFLGSIFGKKE